jgi:hypothetical protein
MRTHGAWILTVAVGALVCSSAVVAANVTGTPRNDTLRGTARSDTIDGRKGNDRLFGRGGNDLLIGGAGNDLLDGGPGIDRLRCGAGNDVANAEAGDRVGADCETVKGLPTLSLGDASVAEGDAGQVMVSLPLTLSSPVRVSVSVRFSTADGSASAANDYVARQGVATIAVGQTSATIDVPVVGDTTVEADETLTVTLSGAVNATILDGSGTGTISNDDRPKPRGGAYSGPTSQGRTVKFVVSADLTRLSDLEARLDIECPSVQFQANDLPITMTGSVPIDAAWRFEVTIPVSGSNVTGTFSLTGGLAAPGSASGNMRLDVTIQGIRCTSNNIPWSAS